VYHFTSCKLRFAGFFIRGNE